MGDVVIDWNAAGGIIDSRGEIVGQIGVAGIGSMVRIPVPGTNGLAIELSPRGWTPKGGSTSTLFIQDIAGKRFLRLDYGFNIKSNAIDVHWNQKGVAQAFGITNHAPAGKLGSVLLKGARYFRWCGRVLVVVGAAADAYSVVTSDRPWRQLAIVVGGATGAWAGCKVIGALGALGGTAVEPGGGTAIGGIGGCLVGSVGGYWAGKTLVTKAIDSGAVEHVKRDVVEIFSPPASVIPPLSPGAGRTSPGFSTPSVGLVK